MRCSPVVQPASVILRVHLITKEVVEGKHLHAVRINDYTMLRTKYLPKVREVQHVSVLQRQQ